MGPEILGRVVDFVALLIGAANILTYYFHRAAWRRHVQASSIPMIEPHAALAIFST
jgi:uncharacterized membrane protein